MLNARDIWKEWDNEIKANICTAIRAIYGEIALCEMDCRKCILPIAAELDNLVSAVWYMAKGDY